VPYVIDKSLGSDGVEAVKQAIADYHHFTCIKFIERKKNEVEYLKFYKGQGCSSPVGYRKGRVNMVSLGSGCWHKGSVMHEVGHSMGFDHEQSRPDRDSYVEVVYKNIMEGFEFNFKKRLSSEVDLQGTKYDLESMMHYGQLAFSKNGQRTIVTRDFKKHLLIGQRRGFSNTDILQLNLMYKCHAAKITVAPRLCEDTMNGCDYYKRNNLCNKIKFEKWLYDVCYRTCFHCGLSGTLPPTPPASRTTVGGCVDKRDKMTCGFWQSQGWCKDGGFKDFMKKNCCRTCRDAGW